jgi:hypothetical protein
MQKRLLAVHWRLRQYSLLPGAMGFRTFARTGWRPFDLAGVPLAGDDLALGGRAIADTDAEPRRIAESTARERHQAINWLLGDHPVYSRVDLST